jgi:hypothetical protein
MITQFKYFCEKTDDDFEEYNKQWDDSKERFIFLQTNLKLSYQLSFIKHQMNDNKDILAIRFPTIGYMKKNKIIGSLQLGNGIMYDDNKIWYPKEVWIYHVLH